MARCRYSGKNVRKMARKFNIPIVKALTRGGTGHRTDLFLATGEIVSFWPNSEIWINDYQWNPTEKEKKIGYENMK